MDYLDTIEIALDYIENNLYTQISLQEVASEVGYSYFHFTRLFKEITGFNLSSYLTARKLATSANVLLERQNKLIDISTSLNYNSYEVFSRNFHAMFERSPYCYRRRNRKDYIFNCQPLTRDLITHIQQAVTSTPKMMTIPSITIVGKPYTDKLSGLSLNSQWQALKKELVMHQQLIPDVHYAVCQSKEERLDNNGDCTYQQILGFDKISIQHIPTDYSSHKLKGGKYLVFSHTGDYHTLGKTYHYIWGIWQFCTPFKINRQLYSFEKYEQNKVDIHIPIK